MTLVKFLQIQYVYFTTIKSDNVVEIQAIPDSNDIIGLKDLYLQFSIAESNISVVEDIISTGADTSGANYVSTSSFTNGSKVRGDIITDSASSTLVGYIGGQPYYGSFHTMSDGSKMTGSTHSSDSQLIYKYAWNYIIVIIFFYLFHTISQRLI